MPPGLAEQELICFRGVSSVSPLAVQTHELQYPRRICFPVWFRFRRQSTGNAGLCFCCLRVADSVQLSVRLDCCEQGPIDGVGGLRGGRGVIRQDRCLQFTKLA